MKLLCVVLITLCEIYIVIAIQSSFGPDGLNKGPFAINHILFVRRDKLAVR